MRKRQLIRSLLMVCASIMLHACSTGASPEVPKPSTTATQGSYYVLSAHSVDSLGREIPGTATIRTTTVVASNISFQGESNVTQFYDGNTFYWSFPANGDLKIWNQAHGAGARPGWLRVPIHTGGTSALISLDTSWTYNGTRYRETETQQYTVLSTEPIVVRGKSISTVRVAFNWFRNDGLKDPTDTIWFAPELGFIVRERMPAGINRYGYYSNGGAADLIDYTIQ